MSCCWSDPYDLFDLAVGVCWREGADGEGTDLLALKRKQDVIYVLFNFVKSLNDPLFGWRCWFWLSRKFLVSVSDDGGMRE